jgi:hypothetical protein
MSFIRISIYYLPFINGRDYSVVEKSSIIPVMLKCNLPIGALIYLYIICAVIAYLKDYDRLCYDF